MHFIEHFLSCWKQYKQKSQYFVELFDANKYVIFSQHTELCLSTQHLEPFQQPLMAINANKSYYKLPVCGTYFTKVPYISTKLQKKVQTYDKLDISCKYYILGYLNKLLLGSVNYHCIKRKRHEVLKYNPMYYRAERSSV